MSGSFRQVAKHAKQVKPILSTDHQEARRRVISLYKAIYRHIPDMILDYQLPKTEEQCVEMLKKKFQKHRHVQDIRIIDLLVLKGQMEFQEIVKLHKMQPMILNYWNEPNDQPRPSDFMGKFLDGQ